MWTKIRTFTLISAIAFLLNGCLASLFPAAVTVSPTPGVPGAQTVVSLEKYNQVQTGMTLAQVEAILGKGSELSRTETPGMPVTTIYTWIGLNGGVTVTFQNDQVLTKTQTGLK